ncbi:MAG TPA: DUF11 domain-containing protein, partial [Dehalococcoidia bacterium]|nr:DUF11 domain-containing protein [Dehalococcoidia bacterium]
VSLAAQVDGGVTPGSVLTVTAAATTSDAEARLDNNTDAFEVIVQPSGPDLLIGSSIGEAAMTVGQPVTFTLSVANFGNAPASGTGLTLTLPLSVTLRSATPAPSSSGGSNVAWGLGNLAPGASQQVTVTVDLDGALATTVPLDPQVEAGGLLTYTVQAGSPTPDIDTDNNVQELVKRVEYPGSDLSASLAAEGVGPDGTFAAGQEITYTVRYGNFGNQVAPTTTVTLSLGSGLSLVSAQPAPARTESSSEFPGGTLGWDVGNVAVGASDIITARVRVASVPEDGSMVLATVSGRGREIAPLDNAVFERWLPGTGGGAGFRTYLPAVMRSFQPGW